MRRLGLFTGFLLLLGLTTAVAASFDVQAEDISTFSTPVSITVPDPPGAEVFYLRGAPTTQPGILDTSPPPNNNTVRRTILLGDQPPAGQTDPARLHVWDTAVRSTAFAFGGQGTLVIHQNGGNDRLTAALFDCPGNLAATSLVGCTGIGGAAVNSIDLSSGYKERTVNFGPIPSTTIGPGRVLRLKIVNHDASSTSDWSLQWGHNPARSSQLQIVPPAP